MCRRKTLFIFSFLVFLSISINGSCQNSFGLSLPKGKKYITIPFQLFNNLIIVKINYNRIINLNFILDTGVRTAILTDSKMSILLNPEVVREIKIGGLGGEEALDAQIATGLSFTMSSLKGQDQLMIILKDDAFSLSQFIGMEVHGILGYEIFNRFVVVIDYKNKLLKLYEPEKYKPSTKGVKFPITIEDTKPFLNAWVQIKNKKFPVKLIIDTGAGHALALYPGAHPDIQLPDTVFRSLLGRGLTGDINGSLGRIKSFSLGKYEFSDIIVSFPDSADVGETFKSNERHGNLGAEILSHFKVTFNYMENYIILEKQKGKNENFYFNMSGMDVISKGDDLKTFEVDYVRESSPAHSEGIRTGDIIVEINGKSHKEYNLSDINSIFHSKPGRKINLKIKRGNEVLKKTIILRQII